MKVSSRTLFKKSVEIFQNLPKQHRGFIIASSCFLLLLLIIPSSEESLEVEEIKVGKRIQVTLPEDIVPLGTIPRQSALPQRSSKAHNKIITEPLPSLARPQITQQGGSLTSGKLQRKI
ncbi:MAG: hypothetical protein ACI952_002352, partial [Flavobacteriales bacterium]